MWGKTGLATGFKQKSTDTKLSQILSLLFVSLDFFGMEMARHDNRVCVPKTIQAG
jgi:hypothetical protein